MLIGFCHKGGQGWPVSKFHPGFGKLRVISQFCRTGDAAAVWARTAAPRGTGALHWPRRQGGSAGRTHTSQGIATQRTASVDAKRTLGSCADKCWPSCGDQAHRRVEAIGPTAPQGSCAFGSYFSKCFSATSPLHGNTVTTRRDRSVVTL